MLHLEIYGIWRTKRILSHQYVRQPTHIAGNILDLVFTNNPEIIHSINCQQTLRSVLDHYIVECSTVMQSVSSTQIETKPDFHSPLDKLNFFDETIKWDDVNNMLRSFNWVTEFDGLSPNEMLSRFIQIITNCCQTHIPVKKTVLKQKIPQEFQKSGGN